MTDITTESPPTIEASSDGMTPESRAGFIELSVSIGTRSRADADAILAAHGLKAPAPELAPLEPGAFNDMGLTPEQVKQMERWAVEDGVVTQEEVDAARAARGEQPPAAQSELDKHLAEEGVPPATAKEFDKLPPLLTDPTATDSDVVTAHRTVTDWLTTGKVSRETGHNLAHVASEFAPKWQAMSEADRHIHHRTTENLLQRAWGDQFDARVQRAQRLVNEIDAKKPGFKQYIEDSGLGNDVAFCTLFSNHAELLHGRHLKKESKK